MRRGELYMYGSVFPVKAKQNGALVRPVVVQEAARLPPRSETNIIGCTVFRDLANTWNTWVSSLVLPQRSCG